MSTSTPAHPSSGAPTHKTPAQIQTALDLGIWHTLQTWPILTLALQNQWGGPNSADKRDWLAGAISELISPPSLSSNASSSGTNNAANGATAGDSVMDAEDLEVVLLQALEDEFGVRLEDESEVGVAAQILRVREEVLRGEFATVDAMQRRWMERGGKEVGVGVVEGGAESVDGESESEDESEGDGDVEMDEAPELVDAEKGRETGRREPEIDEEGFERVVGKRRR